MTATPAAVSAALADENFCEGSYRVFDKRRTDLTDQSKGFLERPVYEVMRHLKHKENLAIRLAKTGRNDDYYSYLVARGFVYKDVVCPLDSVIVFPLCVDPEDGDLLGGAAREPNLDESLVARFEEATGLRFAPEAPEDADCRSAGFSGGAGGSPAAAPSAAFTPEDLLHYVYAVLYSPAYRARYKAVIRGDFPRVPLPTSAAQFRRLAALGARLAAIHLMESEELADPPATYPESGDNRVEAIRFESEDSAGEPPAPPDDAAGKMPALRQTAGEPPAPRQAVGRIYINARQYFGEATARSWDFYIGGYQPAQKWLKDRKGRILSPDEIVHYARILRALDLTAALMTEIDAAATVKER